MRIDIRGRNLWLTPGLLDHVERRLHGALDHHWDRIRAVTVRLFDRNGDLGGVRQWIESVNQTLKGQLDLERHGGRTPAGVFTRIAQRLLAMAAGIWHNWETGVTSKRSLIAFDH